MSRFRWSIVACGLAVAVACSFEAARAKDKDPKQPAGGAAPAPAQPKQVAPVQPKPVAPAQPRQVAPAPAQPRQVAPAPAQPRQVAPAPAQPRQVAPVAPIQVAPAIPKQVAPNPVVPSAPRQVQPQPQPQPGLKPVVPSTQPSVGKSTGTPLQPFQPNKAGNTAPAGKPAVGSGVPGIPGGTGADTKVNPPGAVGRPPVVNNPVTVKPGGSGIPGGQKIEAAKPSGGIGPAPSGIARPGVPEKPSKTFNESRSNSLGVAPDRTNSGGKPKLKVEPGTLNPVVGGNSGGLTTDPSGIARPGVPEKPSKTLNESRSNALGVAPDRTNSGGKPKLKVEPGAGPPSQAKDIPGIDIKVNPKGKGDNAARGSSVGTGTEKPTLGGKGGSLPFDPKGTVKLNPQPEPPGKPQTGAQGVLSLEGREKTKPLAVSKNGTLTLAPPKGAAAQKDGKVLQLSDKDKQEAAHRDEVLHGLFGASKKGSTATLLPLGTDDKNKKPPVDLLPLGTDKDKKDGRNTATLMQFRERDNMHHELNKLKASPELQSQLGLKHVNLDKVSGVHQERLAKPENFQNWQQSNVGQKLHLHQQFELQRQGDLARRMNLSNNLISAGGWSQHRHHGVIAAGFTTGAFSMWYAGGGCYPSHAWCPTWSPWVNWSYWGTCPILYDPRPYYCIPVVYDPCVPWVYYDYPVWNPLPVVACGTWIDVSPIVVVSGQDLQLLAVRFVDNGHPEQNQGPRYRAWVRNNSPTQILTPFSVQLLASNDQIPRADLPQSGVVIPTMDIGETQVLDIRLPLAANRLGLTPEGHRVPFAYLHVLVDSHQQIPETFEDNNGSVLLRKDILPVDPVAFSTDLTASAPEGLLTLAGEGLGPEPGQVFVSVYGQQVQAEINGWYDLGIRFEVPNFELSQPVDAEILVVRGDGAVSNPLTVRLAPKDQIEEAPAFPDSPIPDPPQ